MKSKEEIIEEMQKVVEQMRLDDLEESLNLKKNILIVLAAGRQNLMQVLFNMVNTGFVTTVFYLLKQVSL